MEEDPDQGLFALLKSFIRKKFHSGNSNDLEEEIHDLVDEGQAKGLISNEESHMVYGVLDLKETTANSIMIPRTVISSAPINSTLGEIIKLVNECGHTRIPIHKDNMDEIIGILHAKDLLKLWGEDPDSILPVKILRSPTFVPGTQKINKLFRDLKNRKTHLAIVTDEYGGTAGIITIEDIIEEIVGEIMDEHDNEKSLVTIIDDNSLLVDARLEVEKLEEYLAVELPKGGFESVGGFVIHLMGRIPQVNEKISYKGLEIVIKKADQRKIEKVLITYKPVPEPHEENSDSLH